MRTSSWRSGADFTRSAKIGLHGRALSIAAVSLGTLLAPRPAAAMHLAEGVLPLGWCAVWNALALPFVAADLSLLGPVLFLAGGTISGIYTLGVILIGQEFRGQRLAIVSTAFAMAYSAGAVVGSTPIGLLIDLFGAGALPVAIAVSFLGLAVCVWRQRAAHQDMADQPAARDNLPLSAFDEGEAIDVEHPEVGDLEMRDDRERKERDLEERLVERAAETAGGAAERHQLAADLLERTEAHQSGERQRQLGKNASA